ncbi:MAG: hypothetical protein ACTSV2_11375 [Candidatus Thorarchaeota archaeon]
MTSEIREHLETIGVGISSRDSTILKTILLLKDGKVPTTFSEIKKHLNETLEIKLGKQWIYKCLVNLEQEGFILVDRMSSPKIYQTDTNRIKDVLERKITEATSELVSERKRMHDNIETLEKQDMKTVADYMMRLARVSDFPASSKILEGNLAVKNAIIEMCSGASKNDIIRISEKIKMQDLKGMESGQAESTWMLAAQNGAKAQILVEFSSSPHKDLVKDIKTALGDIFAVAMDAIKKGNIMIRTSTGTPFPHKLTALNNEAMVVSLMGANLTADDGILVRSVSNPDLFTDVIDNFDRIWDQAQDVVDILFGV